MSSSEINNIQALDPGTIISSGTTTYTIKEILGAGAFGITYLATGLHEMFFYGKWNLKRDISYSNLSCC